MKNNSTVNNEEQIFDIFDFLLEDFSQNHILGPAFASLEPGLPILDEKGVCAGLSIDFGRYMLNHKSQGRGVNYVNKIYKKLDPENFKSRRNFVQRIYEYQAILFSGFGEKLISDLFNSATLHSYLNKLQHESSVYYISLSEVTSRFGHAIVLYIDKDKENNIHSDSLFDPNFGEFKTDKLQKICLIIESLAISYQYNQWKIINLEKFLVENNFLKSQSKKYDSSQKYPTLNDRKNQFYSQMLCNSCNVGDIESVRIFLKRNDIDININNGQNTTPLLTAYTFEHFDIVNLLLEDSRINLNLTPISNRFSLLGSAIAENDLKTLNLGAVLDN